MRFDCETGEGPEGPCEVLDANGIVIPRVIRGDTNSGLVERYAIGKDGSYVWEGNRVKTIIDRHPAPLYIKPITQDKTN